MSNGDRLPPFKRFSEPFSQGYSTNTGDRIDRTTALGLLKEIDLKTVEESHALLPKLLSFLKHNDPVVVRQSISTGTSLFCAVLTKMALQIHNSDNVDGWLEEMWNGMLQFKDAVLDMLRHDSTSVKTLAVKFLENCCLLFTSDGSDVEEGKGCKFNISCLARVHPMLNPSMLAFETSKILNIFWDILKSAPTLSGPIVITTINCLASIAKKRPLHYHSILSSLLSFDPNFGTITGSHAASIQYAVRLAILGFLRCTHSSMFESRENLLRALRSKYPGESTEQSIRQMEKISRNLERSSREARLDKDGQQIDEIPSKKLRLSTSDVTNNNSGINNSGPTPTEQVLIAIGALLAEGEKGSRSLDLLINELDSELLADIVIESMKQFPESPPSLPGSNGNMQPNSHITVPSVYSQTDPTIPSILPSDVASTIAGIADSSIPTSDKPMIPPNNFSDLKRDPRRDPRRPDLRRPMTPNDGVSASLNSEPASDIQYNSINSSKPIPPIIEDEKEHLVNEAEFSDNSVGRTEDEHIEITNSSLGMDTIPPSSALSPENTSSLEIDESKDDYDDSIMLEHDQDSSLPSTLPCSEDVCHDYSEQPLFFDMEDEQKKALCRFSITHLIGDPTQIQNSSHSQTRLQLLARMVAQMDADDDLVTFFRKHIILDYHHNKGHDLAMYVLFHLHAVAVSESDEHIPSASKNYEKFLLAIAKILIDAMPASDKSFSRLLGEAPFLPESAFKLLEDLCQSCGYENHTKDASEVDRISQGLSALWNLILGRPNYRRTCLDIALKCAIHAHEEVRAKAIRLVSNKLFILPYASEDIEKFAQSTLLSAIDQVSETETKHNSSGHTIEGSSKISCSPSHNMELGTSEDGNLKNIQAVSLLNAQQQTSLFFSLCSKKPALLHLLFNIYGRAPKVVKQSIHRNVPNLIKNLAPSYSELLLIISDPPEGSENLIILVLQLITEETTPSADLITAVKHLYDTKLKDVSILIPMLSSLSKAEVLPIFPRLVNLQLEKFQAALARILQGSAHTGPALTPFEVLIAIHDVDPSRDGVPLKKITDACTACFEQRTVFTQQVLAKSLSHMVEQVPLPMLFMRTLIQSINTFPVLVEFAMGILSKLVNRQIWKMPKFWVGFLKLASQTHPHSFSVLLQLPSPQLENALIKYANLRAPLAAYASQPNVRATLERSTLQVLGLENKDQTPTTQSFLPADS